jgi:hypothetical protein
MQCKSDILEVYDQEIEGSLEERYQDAAYDKMYEKAKCLSAAKTGKKNNIAGKWKLIWEINGSDTTDRSCEEIVYHFREDGMLRMLTVSNSIGKQEDDVAYEYSVFPLDCANVDPQANLRMGETEFFCRVLLTKMILYPWKYSEIGKKVISSEIRTFFLRID